MPRRARLNPKLPARTKSRDQLLSAMLVPVARLLLRHGLSAGELFHAAKHAYVDAAIAEVTPAGRKPNVSRISVMTGLTRKEVAALVAARQNNKTHAIKRTMRQRALRVLEGWQLDPRFARDNGRPANLTLKGRNASFNALVRKYGGDVTPVAVLRELERMHGVSKTRTGQLKFSSSRKRSGPTPELVEFAQLLKDFAESVSDRGLPDRPPLFRGFREVVLSSADQVALFKRTFARRGIALLDGVTDWSASQDDGGRESAKHLRVGIGVYLVDRGARTDVTPPRRAPSRVST